MRALGYLASKIDKSQKNIIVKVTIGTLDSNDQ